ncbi:hypothetical protein P389DRAFT_39994 [Cystobasidium minutum MCA 4210]|uniref:uncharacterized protein n=1 Tax=Cystobasidium minutum MCA 4210 TaxID=1397322 RepID=UPI0034CFC1E0|eukprot:jgi/Rhomi1/39994/CE39993_3264
MEDAPSSRQRGPPDERSSSSSRYSPPPRQQQQTYRQRDADRSDRLPLRARAPLDDDSRYYPRGSSTNGSGPSSSLNGAAGPPSSSSSAIPAGGQHDKRSDNMERDRPWRGYRDDRSTPYRPSERSYSRSAGPSGPLDPAGQSSSNGGANGQGSSSSSNYRRFGQQSTHPYPHQRTRSQSPPGSSSAPYYSSGPASQSSSRQRFEHSPPKRPWGGPPRDNRDSLPPSSSYDRDGSYRGTPRSAPYSDRRPNGVVGPPPLSSAPYGSDRFSRPERDSRNSRTEDYPDNSSSRRPFDNGWPRHARSHGDANGWRDDKGKGPAYDLDERRPSFSRNNQNNPPHSASYGDRPNSPDSARSRGRRSPSIDDFPLRSPASSTHSQSRLSDRLAVDYDRPPPRTFSQPRLSAPPGSTHPPLNRANSAGQPAPRRDFEFPPDRPPDALETRLSRSVSVSQGNTPKFGNKGWPPRRRSLSPSPTREGPPTSTTTAKTQSSPRSLAERLGPLASAAKDFQDRIEPVVFRSRTPPPRSPARQSAPSTLQNDRLAQPAPRPIARSFTPPLPSPAQRCAQRPVDAVQQATKDASPSPKLASSPSEAAISSPRPSTTDLEQATSEITQARTSPDTSKEDESMQEIHEEREEGQVEDDTLTSTKAQQPAPSDTQQRAMDKLPRAPVPLATPGPTSTSDSQTVEPEKADKRELEGKSAEHPAVQEASIDNAVPSEDSAAMHAETVEVVTKVEVVEVEMEAAPETSETPGQSGPSQTEMETADVSDASIVIKNDEMDVDGQQEVTKAVQQEVANTANQEEPPQQEAVPTNQPSYDEEAQDAEEDAEAKEFEKSLISFIEVNDPDEDDASVDLTNILEDNKLKAPISLPLAVHMPEPDHDLLEIQPMLLENHDLLDGFLQDSMAARDKRRGEKIFRLRQQYKELDAEWQVHCNKLEKIRDRQKRRQNIPIMPPTPSVDSAGISIVPTTPNLLAPSGRSNRRSAASSIGYGDAVRSEAEFLEILASLEDADMRDPNLRAMRTTATMPDQIIDESEYTLQRYDDNNGLVTNPFEHYNINKTPDSWTEEEIATFCRRYALYPKQFGKIAAALPDKSTNQCVLFYYRSKKKIDFRALVDRRNRDGRRKRTKGEKGDAGGKKGPSLLNNIERARGAEAEEDDDDEPQTPGAAIAQESTVLSTAKALTQQINGVSDIRSRPENGKRPPTGRSASGKKAARFLSPSDEQSATGTDDGVPPPSDGAMAAAEALGFLATVTTGDPNDPASRPTSAKQKKRKPSMSESTLNVSFDDDGTPRAVNAAKRSRPHSSSYWSVADKNEFIRLLMLHGKDYVAISEGIKSKTAVQCKNFFQNNVKKMNLAEIAAKAEGEFGSTSGDFGLESPMGRPDMPSVFGEPDGSMPQEPTSGYFIPSHHSKNRDTEEHKPSARSGGMHLRNLLDDAPDAEGGANPHLANDTRMPGDDDSATEDEAEPARYAQDSLDARGALRQAHAERTASQQRHASRVVKEEMISVDSALYRSTAAEHGHYQPHIRSSSFGSRQDFPPEREQYSPSFHPAHHTAREYSLPPRHVYGSHPNGHYETGQPHAPHWIPPYEGRSIYGPPASATYYPRSRADEQPPVGYYRREHPAYLDSPVYDKSVHRTAFPPRSLHQSPHYAGTGRSPPHQPGPPLRHHSDPTASHPESPYYEHYGVPRAS